MNRLSKMNQQSPVPYVVRDVNSSKVPQTAYSLHGAPSEEPILRRQEEWMSWAEVCVKVMKLPKTTTTLDVYDLFSKEGNIIKIDIYEQSRTSHPKYGTALIIFKPPPARPFWKPSYSKCAPHSHLKSSLIPRHREFVHQSPVHPEVSYPERTVLIASKLDFGFMVHERTMMVMHSIVTLPHESVVVTLNLLSRVIDIQFPLIVKAASQSGQYWAKAFQFRLPFSKMEKMYRIGSTSKKFAFVIPFGTPPRFRRKIDGDGERNTHGDRNLIWNEGKLWHRVTDICNQVDWEVEKSKPISLKKKNPLIDIGRWTTYSIILDEKRTSKDKFDILRQALGDYNVQTIQDNTFKFMKKEEADIWKWIVPDSSHYGSLSSIDYLNSHTINLDFQVRYQLEACLSHGYLNEHNLTQEFIEKLSSINQKEAKARLEAVADRKVRFFNPMDIYGLDISHIANQSAIPRYCAYIRSAVVTPSMIYYASPQVETSNRIIRQYIEYSDRFLRVRFSEELMDGRVNGSDDNSEDAIFDRIKRSLVRGITIGDRHYEFLAFGNSQLRESGAYFFCPTIQIKSDDIRAWMGDFTGFRTVAKYAARLGQSFSTTRAIAGTKVNVKTMADIRHNGYCFSDGVGKISRFLAQMIADEIGLPNSMQDPPSLFQFRLGGAKGVVVLADDAREREIIIRKTQNKFAAMHDGLEIIRMSSFASATLNRQIIAVLSTLGVKDEIFVSKLQLMLTELEEAMEDEKMARRLLSKNIDYNQMTLTLSAMIEDGFMTSREPFMQSLLRLWRTWTIKYLKEKARITVEKGAFLLGCVDEIGKLRGYFEPKTSSPSTREDVESSLAEIFVQISDPDPERKGKYTIIEGICVLGRNPSLHPGDLRIVRAVDVPELHHLKNVVVLPQTGDRDLANMCSGGDLDGDDYFVMWDEDLLPDKWNHAPMDYKALDPIRVKCEVTVRDVTTFFVEYMKYNRLGIIAHAHLAIADSSDLGVMDEKCIELAHLHSTAVDYAKTGVAPKVRPSLIPKKYPHFMEKSKNKTYNSRKVLGKLYDQVERSDFNPVYESPFDQRILGAYTVDEKMLANAEEIKATYDSALRRIMAQHEIKTEFEVWTAFVLSHNFEKQDYTFSQDMGLMYQALRQRFQTICKEKAGGEDFDKLAPFIVAMYTVTKRQVDEALTKFRQEGEEDGESLTGEKADKIQMPLISFPWIFFREMGRIAKRCKPLGQEIAMINRDVQRRSQAKKHDRDVIVNLRKDQRQVEKGDEAANGGEMLILFDDLQDEQEAGACSERSAVDVKQDRADANNAVNRSILDETHEKIDAALIYEEDIQIPVLKPDRVSENTESKPCSTDTVFFKAEDSLKKFSRKIETSEKEKREEEECGSSGSRNVVDAKGAKGTEDEEEDDSDDDEIVHGEVLDKEENGPTPFERLMQMAG